MDKLLINVKNRINIPTLLWSIRCAITAPATLTCLPVGIPYIGAMGHPAGGVLGELDEFLMYKDEVCQVQ